MDEIRQDLLIPIKGLPLGGSSFSFVIDGKFFQKFGNAQIKDADCSVKVYARKHQTLVSVECEVCGFVIVECDRCLDDLTLKVDVSRTLTVGFGSVDIEDEEGSEDVVIVEADEAGISVDQFVYDYVCLSLPIVKVHPEGRCNPDMLRYLSKSATVAGKEATDTPFDNLKELLDDKK